MLRQEVEWIEEDISQYKRELEKQVKDEEGKRQVIEREQKIDEREKEAEKQEAENRADSTSQMEEWNDIRVCRKKWLAYCDEKGTQTLAAEGKERDAKEEVEKYKQANLMLQTKVLALEAKLAEKKPAKKRKRQN